MITDEMLRVAATRSCEIYANHLEKGYDPESQYVFSPEFEKKIKKLKRKADHPVFYRTMQRVASIVLVIFITGGAFLTINAEARAAFVGWVKEIYETYVAFIFENKTSLVDDNIVFRPSWVPDGYTEIYCDDSEDTVFVAYSNEAGQMMNFSYIYAPDETKWLVDKNNAIVVNVEVNGRIAEMFISTDFNNASAILWTNENNTAFYLSGFLDQDELIRVAESVSSVEK